MKLSRISRAGTAVIVGALALTLAACGSDNPTGDATGDATNDAAASPAAAISGTFAGAGSSAQANAIKAWTAAFQSDNPDVTINYDDSGSGAGREQFIAGGLAWAGSDSALKDEEIEASQTFCGADGAINIPVYISPIAIAYNLPGVADLNLSAENIAKIFTGAITTWDDPAIVADNPDASLPATAITPVHRSDKSGTTNNFTDWLHANAGDIWTDEKNDAWPLQGGDSAQGTSGVAGVLSQTEGSVGYIDESGVTPDLNIAKIKVGDTFTALTPEGAAAVVSASPLVEGRSANDVSVQIDRTATAEGDYPLLLVSYAIACQNYSDAATGEFAQAWLSFIVSPEAQDIAAQAAGSAPLAGEIADKAAAAAASITVG
ncbi:phosphate ABC transporter substrate-binding protein PstS [Xylanimonas ulmi]|uniref:phosphate ABC transporter substrate-binding protein PstS n=1 Tax=Xylanimonas ulmi TaxID=228973 RepID=UPI001F5F7090|nr:phosphate ABC transporter substrate-binding protein PstS [Xylanibacterium ulmi]